MSGHRQQQRTSHWPGRQTIGNQPVPALPLLAKGCRQSNWLNLGENMAPEDRMADAVHRFMNVMMGA